MDWRERRGCCSGVGFGFGFREPQPPALELVLIKYPTAERDTQSLSKCSRSQREFTELDQFLIDSSHENYLDLLVFLSFFNVRAV